MRLEKLSGSGKYLHPVTIEQQTGTTTDKNGKKIPEWTTYADVFARVTYLSGDDALVIRQRIPTASHTVEMYALAGLTEKMRVKWGEKVLHIEDQSDPNAGEIMLTCHEAK
jgi:SPP1 family predicted phage head-tail adaptor